jgi:hypothetical protein
VEFYACPCKNPIMATDSRRKKRPRDPNQRAFQIVQEATGQSASEALEPPDTRNPAAVALSKLGASKGGQARAARLTPKKRKQIAAEAAKARWAKQKHV